MFQQFFRKKKERGTCKSPLGFFTIDVSISKEKVCFEPSKVTQDPYGLSFKLLILWCSPNCTWMFFIILQRYLDIFCAIWWVFRGLRIKFLSLCKFVHARLADNHSFLTPCLYVQNRAETRTGLGVNYCLCVLFLVVFAVPYVGSGQTCPFATAGLPLVVVGSSACSWEISGCYKSEFIFKILISFPLWSCILFYASFSYALFFYFFVSLILSLLCHFLLTFSCLLLYLLSCTVSSECSLFWVQEYKCLPLSLCSAPGMCKAADKCWQHFVFVHVGLIECNLQNKFKCWILEKNYIKDLIMSNWSCPQLLKHLT